MKKNLFTRVITYGVAGSALGIVAGLIFGLSIWGLQELVGRITGMPSEMSGPPGTIYTMLGMCFGALLGGINGAAVGMKEEKNNRKN